MAMTMWCRYAYAVHYKSHSKDADGVVTEVHVEYEPALQGKPPKGVVNWVARPAPGKEPMRAEARLYSDAVRLPALSTAFSVAPHTRCCVRVVYVFVAWILYAVVAVARRACLPDRRDVGWRQAIRDHSLEGWSLLACIGRWCGG